MQEKNNTKMIAGKRVFFNIKICKVRGQNLDAKIKLIATI